MDQTNSHAVRRSASDIAAQKAVNTMMKKLFPTKDFYCTSYDRVHYDKPFEVVDAYNDVRS